VKILVLGGGGQVARAVAASVPHGHTVIVKTRAALDITSEAAVAALLDAERVDWIVNGAAYTAVDLAERESEKAHAINAAGVGIVARQAALHAARLIHLSTDFVFDGQSNRAYLPTDRTSPLSVYGLSKLAGEQQAFEAGGDPIVLRTAWVYASTGKNFALTMLRLMRERDEVRVVCDQIGTPTWAVGIAGAIWGFMQTHATPGLYHWTDLGVASWYDFAVAIQEEALARGLLTKAVPVLPIPTSAYPTPAQRPAFSVLNTDSARLAVPYPAQHWRHNLRMMLDELRAA
jgi:dTDP-4-dehydrorhamnose reductase